MSAADRGWYPHLDPLSGDTLPVKQQKAAAPRNKSTITEAEIAGLVEMLDYPPEVFEELGKKAKRRWFRK
jgi:hypothetical protein